MFPDLVLSSLGRTSRLAGVVEVETAESVNNLEALAQWAHLARANVPFSLYVPAGSVDMARRLCADNQVAVDEIWSFFALGMQVRFTLVHRAPAARKGSAGSRARSASVRRSKPAARGGAGGAARAPAAKRPGSARAVRSAERPAIKSRTPARKTVAAKKTPKPARSRKR
ncbi:MAG: hypothetical protein ABIG85_04815 [Chloroflexota bacterium]